MPYLRTVHHNLLVSVALSCLAGCSANEGEMADARITTEKHEVSVAGIVTAKSERTTTEPVPDEAEPTADREDATAPQAGLLTAGDHDDLLNPELYASYAGRFLQASGRDLPFVDTRTRVSIKVLDAAGRPVPFARVSVDRPGAPLQLVSAADGSASFYPRFDRVPARTMLHVAAAGGRSDRQIQLPGRGTSNLVVQLDGKAVPVSAMDIAIVLDTTGSMGDEMAYLQAELDSIVARLRRDAGNIDLRIGLILYRDDGDEYVVRSFPLTGDIATVQASLSDQRAEGGGDTPEALDRAIAAAGRMQWRPNAAKALLLVADAPPHEQALGGTLAATQRLRSQGVQIIPVAASGVEDSAQYVMRTMAAMTQGRYIFLTDDSGIGYEHAEPDLSCYVVTRLDQLIGRVLAGIAQGRRIEPTQAEVIRTVGDYRKGRCAVPRTQKQS